MTETTIAATKANFDAASDDPKQARAEFASNVDAFNALVAQSFIGAAVTATALPTNLNDATDPSWYYAFRSSHTNGPTWSGGSVDWLLRTFRYSSVYHYQFLHALTTGGVLYSWTRYNNNGSWSAWQQNSGPNVASLSALSLQSGDLLFALSSGVLSRLGAGSAGQALLMSTDSPTLPEWGDIVTGLGAINIQAFTTSGTYTKSSGYTWALAIVTGGGGGGGGATRSSATAEASGGGGGGTAIKILDLTAITSETVTIGAAGSAGSSSGGNGGAGGTSSIGTLAVATGGSGGGGASDNVNTSEGTGGSGTTADLSVTGGRGHEGGAPATGGGSFWGSGGPGAQGTGAGLAGEAYGAGGGGARRTTNGNSAGGAGAAGVVLIVEFK